MGTLAWASGVCHPSDLWSRSHSHNLQGAVMAEEEAKQKEALNNTLKEYIAEWRKTREKEEEELKKLKEKQARRKKRKRKRRRRRKRRRSKSSKYFYPIGFSSNYFSSRSSLCGLHQLYIPETNTKHTNYKEK